MIVHVGIKTGKGDIQNMRVRLNEEEYDSLITQLRAMSTDGWVQAGVFACLHNEVVYAVKDAPTK